MFLHNNFKHSVEGFLLTKDNYDFAVKLLKDRFAKTQIIVSSHMNALLKLNAKADIYDLLRDRS